MFKKNIFIKNRDDMDKDLLRKKIYSKIDELPTLPDTAARLLSLFEDKNSNASIITKVIHNDPALAAKILKVANSAYYGFSQKISDLERAVALLGFNMVKSLAISIGVMKSLPSQNKSSRSGKELWRHSVTVAILMREMGKRIFNEKDSESFFILGLMHDVGIVVIDQFFNEQSEEILKEAEQAGETEVSLIEKKVLGYDHGEIGGILLTRWKFPELITNAVSMHHQDIAEESGTSKDVTLLKISDALSNFENNIEENQDISLLFKNLGVDEKYFQEILNYKDEAKEEISSFYNSIT